MEIKKRVDFRKVGAIIYIVAFLVYLVIGLTPADAAHYAVDSRLSIPSIGLESDVTALKLENHKLNTPDTIVGSFGWDENRTLLIGHSSTVFYNLKDLQVGESIIYNEKSYYVVDAVMVQKEDIVMEDLLDGDEFDTVVIMTCAGEDLGGGDSTHRLIVTARA